MSTKTQTAEMTLAKTLAPEDVCRGDYVTILTKVCEYPSYYWDCPSQFMEASEVVSIRYRPPESGQPMEVVDVCLPFILVQPLQGKPQTLDVRSCQLAKISNSFVESLRKANKKVKNNKKKRSKKS